MFKKNLQIDCQEMTVNIVGNAAGLQEILSFFSSKLFIGFFILHTYIIIDIAFIHHTFILASIQLFHTIIV
jgi:hypothetical protein